MPNQRLALATVLALSVAFTTCEVLGQEPTPTGPTPRSFAAGVVVSGDSRGLVRPGAWWYASEQLVLGLTGQLWGEEDVFQPEFHWTWQNWAGPTPFVHAALGARWRDGYTGLSFEAGAGGQLFVADGLAIYLGAGWTIVNWESPRPGILGLVDRRNFGLLAGFHVIY